ncbi:MAG: class I SAM-dependent methyltransferase [Rhodobiaceae bacterium]|nr:class I SAM-dependent methyltransferase [Rhodobiaceae bacterium]MCC0055657.1 class I SAM-dependent methyltransferase [Rhodobiaceae bacterium]
MNADSSISARKFDSGRANEYEQQSRIGLAGYDACHELAACVLSATIGAGGKARILAVGAGGGAKEVVTAGGLEPGWTFTAVDPSQAMMDLSITRLDAEGLSARTQIVVGTLADIPSEERFDGATLIGVLHHIPGDAAKLELLGQISERLNPGAPLILAGNRYAYASRPLLLAAWEQRWRMTGSSPEEMKAKLAKILDSADPPQSEEAVADLLAKSGFDTPEPFFSSLFWCAWMSRKQAD